MEPTKEDKPDFDKMFEKLTFSETTGELIKVDRFDEIVSEIMIGNHLDGNDGWSENRKSDIIAGLKFMFSTHVVPLQSVLDKRDAKIAEIMKHNSEMQTMRIDSNAEYAENKMEPTKEDKPDYLCNNEGPDNCSNEECWDLRECRRHRLDGLPDFEGMANDYVKHIVGTHDRPDVTRHDFIQGCLKTWHEFVEEEKRLNTIYSGELHSKTSMIRRLESENERLKSELELQLRNIQAIKKLLDRAINEKRELKSEIGSGE